MDPLTIACSLPAADMRARLDEIATLGREALVDSRIDDGAATLRFRASFRDRLQAIVAAEAKCCGFLDFGLESRDEEIVLTVTASADAQQALVEWTLVFSGR